MKITSINHRPAKANRVRSTSRRIMSVERLIGEHLDAMRAARRLQKKLDRLYAKHPKLKDPRPLIHFHTRGDGEKVYGRWTDDFEAVFPPGSFSPGNKRHIEKLKETANLALPDYNKKRAAAGIEDLENLAFGAYVLQLNAFKNVCTHVPRSAREAGLIARHMIKALPLEAGGQVLGYKFGQGRVSFDAWRDRMMLVIGDIDILLRTFAKAA
jgi:hypothetical protein